eukprot:gene11715-13832_t
MVWEIKTDVMKSLQHQYENYCSHVAVRQRPGKVRYAGVYSQGGKWRAQIWLPRDKKFEYLGVFLSAQAAAEAYDAGLRKVYRGEELARKLNFLIDAGATAGPSRAKRGAQAPNKMSAEDAPEAAAAPSPESAVASPATGAPRGRKRKAMEAAGVHGEALAAAAPYSEAAAAATDAALHPEAGHPPAHDEAGHPPAHDDAGHPPAHDEAASAPACAEASRLPAQDETGNILSLSTVATPSDKAATAAAVVSTTAVPAQGARSGAAARRSSESPQNWPQPAQGRHPPAATTRSRGVKSAPEADAARAVALPGAGPSTKARISAAGVETPLEGLGSKELHAKSSEGECLRGCTASAYAPAWAEMPEVPTGAKAPITPQPTKLSEGRREEGLGGHGRRLNPVLVKGARQAGAAAASADTGTATTQQSEGAAAATRRRAARSPRGAPEEQVVEMRVPLERQIPSSVKEQLPAASEFCDLCECEYPPAAVAYGIRRSAQNGREKSWRCPKCMSEVMASYFDTVALLSLKQLHIPKPSDVRFDEVCEMTILP